MVSRNETVDRYDDTDTAHDQLRDVVRQRSSRVDPDMRDGDSGRGNPYESDTGAATTDNDVGDTQNVGLAAPETGGVPDMADTRVEAPEAMEDLDEGTAEVGPEDGAMAETGRGAAVADRAAAPAAADDQSNAVDAAVNTADEEADAETTDTETDDDPGGPVRPHGPAGSVSESRTAARPAPAADLPIDGYQRLTVAQILAKVNRLTEGELRQVAEFEKAHRNRKTLVTQLERKLRADTDDTDAAHARPRRKSAAG